MKDILERLISELKGGGEAVLVCIVESSGSVPRGAGATMLVSGEKKQTGTVGGGTIEYLSYLHAVKLLEGKSSEHIKDFDLDAGSAASIGMVCGGNVKVLFKLLTSADTEFFERLYEACLTGKKVWLVEKFTESAMVLSCIYDENGALFGGALTTEETDRLLMDKPVFLKESTRTFAMPITNGGSVYIFGGGHVAQELAPVLTHINFNVNIYEDREEFAKKDLFPSAVSITLAPFCEASERIEVSDADYIVIMTRGHEWDYVLIGQMLKTPARYIGCIGSRHKIAHTRARLMKDGFSAEEFDRVHTPIGLDIGGRTPAEIAVSIAAEMIMERSKKQ